MSTVFEERTVQPPQGEGSQRTAAPPLIVDLEATLLKTNLLIESVLVLIRKRPLCLFALPLWMARGKAWFRHEVERRVSLDLAAIPWRNEIIADLRRQRGEGRSLVLVTASGIRTAQQAADHLKLFDRVLAGDAARLGKEGFECAAGADRGGPADWKSAAKALRPTHWLKNLLVFVPIVAAHRYLDAGLVGKCLLAFVAFGLCASSGYLFNDLIDLEADRRHPEKRFRPVAAGDLPLSFTLMAIPALLLAGCLLAAVVSPSLVAILLLYFVMTAGYTLLLKKIAILDVLFLAGLYTVRIMAGSAATGIWPSHWLLAISTFLFFSLALVKRYGELVIMRGIDGDGAKARTYELGDGELLAAMGIASGYLAVLVMALYIATDKAQALYSSRELLWFLCPLLLYWISYVWLTAHRGRMPGDPVLFATGDRTSRILILLMVATALVAL